MKILENADLRDFSSMKVKSRCRRLILPEDTYELSMALTEAKRKDERPLILGGGTNVLFGAEFIDRWVICTRFMKKELDVSGNRVVVSPSYPTQGVVRIALENSLSGLEGLTGIPGTVGGAVAGNSGTKVGSAGDTLVWVEFMDYSGRTKTIMRDEIEFGYRTCSLRGKGIIVRACFKLKREDPEKIKKTMEKVRKLRRNQPAGLNSLGCIFKNPQGTSAGKLIEQLGLKGKRIGGVWVSEAHANFLVSDVYPDPKDVILLIQYIKERAKKAGFDLNEEVEVWM